MDNICMDTTRASTIRVNTICLFLLHSIADVYVNYKKQFHSKQKMINRNKLEINTCQIIINEIFSGNLHSPAFKEVIISILA